MKGGNKLTLKVKDNFRGMIATTLTWLAKTGDLSQVTIKEEIKKYGQKYIDTSLLILPILTSYTGTLSLVWMLVQTEST